MPAVFPTQIEQINDYSHLAGRQVLQAMRDQLDRNPWDRARELIDTAMTNHVNRLTADAVAQYNQGIESGLTAAQALAGIDSWIAGSDKFRDQADKIRASRISQDRENRAEAKWAKEQADAARLLESNALYADFMRNRADLGPGGTAIWLAKHEQDLARNPDAYSRIMETIGKNSDPTLITNTPEPQQFSEQDVFRNAVASRQVADAAAGAGIFDTMAQYKDQKTTWDSYLVNLAKANGNYGNAGFSDLKDNFTPVYNVLSQKATELGLPKEAVFAAMDRAFDAGFLWHSQDSANVNVALKELEKIGTIYHQNAGRYAAAKASADLWDSLLKSGAVTTANQARDRKLENINRLLNSGRINAQEAATLRNYENSQYTNQLLNAAKQSIIDRALR